MIVLLALSFDLYFRKNPFGGEYTVFAGLEECIKFLANFKLSDEEIDFVRDCLPGSEVSKLVFFAIVFYFFFHLGSCLRFKLGSFLRLS